MRERVVLLGDIAGDHHHIAPICFVSGPEGALGSENVERRSVGGEGDGFRHCSGKVIC